MEIENGRGSEKDGEEEKYGSALKCMFLGHRQCSQFFLIQSPLKLCSSVDLFFKGSPFFHLFDSLRSEGVRRRRERRKWERNEDSERKHEEREREWGKPS